MGGRLCPLPAPRSSCIPVGEGPAEPCFTAVSWAFGKCQPAFSARTRLIARVMT